LLGSAPVPVAVFGVAPKTVSQTEWCHRSADCSNPQRVARQTAIKIIPVIARHATRCELGQLALRNPNRIASFSPRLRDPCRTGQQRYLGFASGNFSYPERVASPPAKTDKTPLG
jgi:hypothetical protein